MHNQRYMNTTERIFSDFFNLISQLFDDDKTYWVKYNEKSNQYIYLQMTAYENEFVKKNNFFEQN